MDALVDDIRRELDDIVALNEASVDHYEDFIARHSYLLHANHYLIMTATRQGQYTKAYVDKVSIGI